MNSTFESCQGYCKIQTIIFNLMISSYFPLVPGFHFVSIMKNASQNGKVLLSEPLPGSVFGMEQFVGEFTIGFFQEVAIEFDHLRVFV